MSGMIIPGVAVYGGIFDQVVAWDFLVNTVFGNTALMWPAQIATWLAIAVTITLTAFALLRRIARGLIAGLDAVEIMCLTMKKAFRFRFWTLVAKPFWAGAGMALWLYHWALNKRK